MKILDLDELIISELKTGKYNVNKEFVLSPIFLVKQKAEKNLEALKKHFRIKFQLFGRMKRASKKETLRKLAEEVKQNEYKIQKLYNFKPNDDYFRFWEMPKCGCPKLDNQDRWSTSMGYVYAAECPIHGE